MRRTGCIGGDGETLCTVRPAQEECKDAYRSAWKIVNGWREVSDERVDLRRGGLTDVPVTIDLPSLSPGPASPVSDNRMHRAQRLDTMSASRV